MKKLYEIKQSHLNSLRQGWAIPLYDTEGKQTTSFIRLMPIFIEEEQEEAEQHGE